MGGKRGWVHIASGYDTDVEPCLKERIPVIWVNRAGQKLDTGQKKPTAEVKNLREAVKLLGAG
jgi:2-haloacid dehalogenase/putative hydrolase of the HAD superfamily